MKKPIKHASRLDKKGRLVFNRRVSVLEWTGLAPLREAY